MKIKRYLSAALSAGFLAAIPGSVFADVVEVPVAVDQGAHEAVEDPRVGAAETDAPRYYTIVKGDTLWDITTKYLEDPFRWPKVWRLNPYIKNPHLIYPGNIVRITPDGIEVLAPRETLPVVGIEPEAERVVVLEPPPAPVPPPPPPPPAPRLMSYSMAREGFLTAEEIDASGAIVAPKEDHLLISADDAVYVSFKDRSGVEEGDRFTVYKVGKEVRHPVTKKSLGYLIDILGNLEVTDAGRVIEANVRAAYKEMSTGSRLKPYTEPITEVEITEAGAAAQGYIVASVEGRVEMASGNIVYIDAGKNDGVAAGNLMRAFRRNKTVADPMDSKRKIELPYIDLGTLIVVEAMDRTAACVVVESLRPMRTGDQVSTLFME
jgi:hypothetical protein